MEAAAGRWDAANRCQGAVIGRRCLGSPRARTSAAVLRVSVAIVLAGTLTACASSRYETVKKTIHIESDPPNAMIAMTNHRREFALGAAPVIAEVDLITEYVDWNPWSLVLAGTWCGATAGFAVLGSREESGSAGQPLSIVGAVGSGIVCFFTALDSLITAVESGDKVGTRYLLGPPAFSAQLRGYEKAELELSSDELPPEAPLAFHLKPAVPDQLPALPEGDRAVVAVFEMIGASTSTAAPLTDQLTEYLSTRLAETGRYRIIPREQLRRALIEQKKASYEDCIDDSCQIELGKAVAAQLSLRTQLIHIGRECALSATMYDLKLEATSAGALVRTACTPDKLLDGVESLVKKLSE